jgi:hypothetical protein
MEDHLAGEVTELLLQMFVGSFGDRLRTRRRRGGRQRLDRLDDLVGLLDEVAGQRVVGLLGVPGAAARRPQALDERHQPLPRLAGPSRRQLDEDRREVVGFDDPVEVLQRHGRDGLVGEAEPGEDGDRCLAGQPFQQRQLHVRQHQLRMAVADQQRPGRQGGRERFPVDRPGAAARQRDDGEAEPRQVEERETGHDAEALPEPGPQERHGVLADGGATGNGEADVAPERRLLQPDGDGLVDLADPAGRLVEVVAGDELDTFGDQVRHHRVPERADEPPLGIRGLDGGAGRGQQQIGAPGTETDDDDAARSRAHPTCCVGLPGLPGGSPVSGSVVGVLPLSLRSVLGFGTAGGTTSGAWPVAGGSNVP